MDQREGALVLIAKWPEPGRSKTRLCPPLLPEDAAALARCFLLDMVRELSSGPDRCCVAYSPLAAGPPLRRLLGDGPVLFPADSIDFGQTLLQAQVQAFDRGYRRVALVGADLPHLPLSFARTGLDQLASHDVTIGPSGDGGYYLLGSSRPTPELFRGIAWSTDRVFAQTSGLIRQADLTAKVLDRCDDIDNPADLLWLRAHLEATRPFSETLRLLNNLRLAGDHPVLAPRGPGA